MKKKTSRILWISLTGVFSVLFICATVATSIVFKYENAINMTLGAGNKALENTSDNVFFESSYAKDERDGEARYQKDARMIEEAQAAGSVLLWNKHDALPLAGNEKISLFGHASVDLVEAGSGSGWSRTYDVFKGDDRTVTMKDAFTSRGFEVNETLWDLYETGAGKDYKMTHPTWRCTPWQQWEVNETPWNIVNEGASSSFATYGDAAIITLSRLGGEYSDLHYNYKNKDDFVGDNDKGLMENYSADGGYLGLSDEESELLSNVLELKNKNIVKKVVLLLNTGNQLQMEDIEEYYPGIDACMWIGQPGSTGINAVADLLKGKDMNGNPLSPSGRLPDTWAYDLNSAPATVNDGNYLYGNDRLLSGEGYGDRANAKQDYYGRYMVYQEGIYIGYRYYETRYADLVCGGANANSSKGAKRSEYWDYDNEVAFPFGYGLSYSEFEYSNFSVSERKTDEEGNYYDVNVTVTNIGDYEAREVVQVYLQKDYTQYDKDNGIENAAIELVGYDKTKPLKKGQSENITIRVDEDQFKSYDANNKETYIIEEGNYYLTVGANAHAALNNILMEKGNSNVSDVVMGGESSTTTKIVGDKASAINIDTFMKLSTSKYTGAEITNQLESGDINKYENRGDNEVQYLTRKDWNTYPTEAAKLTLNQEMANDLKRDTVPDDEGATMPVYQDLEGTRVSQGVKVADYSKGDRVAYEFMNAPLDENDERWSEEWEKEWDELLNQMSQDEQILMVSASFHKIHGAVSIALPESYQENGPVGITKREDTKYMFAVPNQDVIDKYNFVFVAYPCAGILAASFDVDIAQRVGEHKSEDMLYLGYNGIYGPGVNMHRSPFGGRAFEYPSEDPYLAGMCEAYETKGIESKGCLAYAKHFALNDMETNRINCGVWSNEQASREIYLRAFEYVFKEGGASATMNAYTRVGTKWAGASKNLVTNILRNEWGFDGIVISDWVTTNSGMSLLDGVMAGTDSFDANNEFSVELERYKDNAAVMQAVRNATKRLIYNVVRTNAMNYFDENTVVISITPAWKQYVIAADVTLGVLAVTSMGCLAYNLFIKNKRKQQDNVSN